MRLIDFQRQLIYKWRAHRRARIIHQYSAKNQNLKRDRKTFTFCFITFIYHLAVFCIFTSVSSLWRISRHWSLRMKHNGCLLWLIISALHPNDSSKFNLFKLNMYLGTVSILMFVVCSHVIGFAYLKLVSV